MPAPPPAPPPAPQYESEGMITTHSCSSSGDGDEDQQAKHVLFWICTTNLKLFDFLLKLSGQILLILHFRLKLTQLKVFSLGRCEERQRERKILSKQGRIILMLFVVLLLFSDYLLISDICD